jgi:hypothetical protein
MRTRSMFPCFAAIACMVALSGCNNGVFLSPAYLSVTISPRPGSIPVGSSVIFTATVSNNLSLPQWGLLDAINASNAGTLTVISGSSNTITYTAPPNPPVYIETGKGVTQGTVTLTATTTDPPGTSIPINGDSVTFVITAPTVTVGLSPATVNLALGATEQFDGYAIGTTNSAVTWEVNGVVGGSVSTGTISSTGVYTAPTLLPMTGNTVTVTVISQADPTKTASAAVTL